MRKTTLLWLWVGLLIYGQSLAVSAAVSPDKINLFYDSINANFTCGNSLMGVELDFDKNFPEEDHADVLATLIERASKTPEDRPALGNALVLATQKRSDGSTVWNKKLETAVLAAAYTPGAAVGVTDILFLHPETGHHDIIISYLQEDDDQARTNVLEGIIKNKWPDALQICDDYIQRNSSKGKHRSSVLIAKGFANPADSKRASDLCQMVGKPDALKIYASYIAAHRDDPNYDVSVDTAERFAKSRKESDDYAQGIKDDEKRMVMFKQILADLNAGRSLPAHSFQERVDLFYFLFSNHDFPTLDHIPGDVTQYVGEIFRRSIPFQEQAPLLAALAEKAIQEPINDAVLMQVMGFAFSQPKSASETHVWNQKLEDALCSQAQNENMFIRLELVQVLQGWNLPNRQDLILSLLNHDPNEMVQEYALGAVLDWPNGRQMIQTYIADHQSDPAYHQIIYAAQERIAPR